MFWNRLGDCWVLVSRQLHAYYLGSISYFVYLMQIARHSSPGPAVYQFATGNPRVMFLWMPAFAIGVLIASKVQKISAKNDNAVCEVDQEMQAQRFSYHRRASCG